MTNKTCVFLDRDGVLNEEIGRHVVKPEEFVVKEGVPEGLKRLKEADFLLIVITNQSGIIRGYYDEAFVEGCYQTIQETCDHVLDGQYFAPGLDKISRSLSRKPDSLMFERAIAKYGIDVSASWMIGDKERDLVPARKLDIKTIHLTAGEQSAFADHLVTDFKSAVDLIIGSVD